MNNKPVRVRFAPSPTGPLHLGGVRTALFNYLFAKQNQGTFILRIEDTDQQRFVPGAEEYILHSLDWCGLTVDEGVVSGGPYAPYRQSERSSIYQSHVQLLLDSGNAYYAFDTPEALEELRNQYQAQGLGQFQYNATTRYQLKNSLTLSADAVNEMLRQGVPYVIRMLIPKKQEVVFHDLIRGEVRFQTDHLDDKVLFKSDGLPTYHLANVVDDFLMKISHVIRGEEWLPSAPMHQLLYRYFGWEEEMPLFAHLPLILKPDGHGKLSKRDGDRLGFPVFPLQWKDPFSGELFRGYREEGYLPEAFVNMLALLGWNPGTEQEIFTMDELVRQFSLDRIQKGGSRFDPEKARWFNHQYVNKLTDYQLAEMLFQGAIGGRRWAMAGEEGPSLPPHRPTTLSPYHQLNDHAYALQVVGLIKDRITLIPELFEHARLFYFPPEHYDLQVKEKVWKPDTARIVKGFLTAAQRLEEWTPESIHQIVQDYTTHSGIKMGQLMMPLRLLVVGSNQGPGIMEIAFVIGKQDFVRRIEVGLLSMQGE